MTIRNIPLLRSLFLLIFSAAGLVAAGVEWRSDIGGNGHRYEAVVSGSPISWEEANTAALARGGYLATVTSAAENAFVQSVVAPEAPVHFWLGGFQQPGSISRQLVSWISGEPFSFSNWATLYFDLNGYSSPTEEPNNAGGDESYLEILPQNGQWNDSANLNLYPQFATPGYVVEYEPPSRRTVTVRPRGAANEVGLPLGGIRDLSERKQFVRAIDGLFHDGRHCDTGRGLFERGIQCDDPRWEKEREYFTHAHTRCHPRRIGAGGAAAHSDDQLPDSERRRHCHSQDHGS